MQPVVFLKLFNRTRYIDEVLLFPAYAVNFLPPTNFGGAVYFHSELHGKGSLTHSFTSPFPTALEHRGDLSAAR